MEKTKHSRLGAASVVMSLIGFFITLALLASAAFLYREGTAEDSVGMILIGIFIFVDIIFLAAGAAVGLAGLFNPSRRRIFCLLGVLFNASIMTALILLLIAGLKIAG